MKTLNQWIAKYPLKRIKYLILVPFLSLLAIQIMIIGLGVLWIEHRIRTLLGPESLTELLRNHPDLISALSLLMPLIVGSLIVAVVFYGIITLIDHRLQFAYNEIEEEAEARRKALVALKKNETIISTVFNAIREAIILIDSDGNLLMANEMAARRVHRSHKEMLAHNINGLFPTHISELRQHKINEMIRRREPLSYDYELENHFYENSVYPVFDDLGNIEKVAIFSRDVTQRRRLEQHLKESEQKYRTIFEFANEGILIVNADEFTVRYANPAFCTISGYHESEVLGIAIPDMYPDDQNELFSHNRALLPNVPLKRKDGSIRYVNITSSAIQMDDRKCLLNFVTDITAIVAVTEEIEKFKSISDNANYGVALTELDGAILYINDYFAAIQEQHSQNLIGTSFFLFGPAYQLIIQMIRAQLETGAKFGPLEVQYHREDGFQCTLLVTGIQMKSMNLNQHYLAFTAVDITVMKETELLLKKAMQTAEEASRTKSEFLANMSHEIRTPINAITGLTGLLQMTQLTFEQQGYVDTMRRSIDALLETINDILDFSKIEAGKLELEMLVMNLNQTIRDVLDILMFRARSKGLALNLKMDSTLPAYVKGDPGRLRQILINLVGNAIKFTEQGQVDVLVESLSQTPDTAVIQFSVRDTGVGISPEQQDGLFQSFTQGDASTTRKYGGTGLGLVISEKLVRLMNGKIGFSSVQNQGSTFWFSAEFPISDLDPGAIDSWTEQVVDLHPDNRKKDIHILLAEDNKVNRMVGVRILEKYGFHVSAVANGREAVEMMASLPFDLILMDIQMPEMDGYEATRQIRALEANTGHRTPIIALTANALKEEKDICMNCGMDDFIPKPISNTRLINTIINYLPFDHKTETSDSVQLSEARFFNKQALLEFVNFDSNFLQEMIQIFKEDYVIYIDQIEQLTLAENWDTLKTLAHKIKGGFSQIGANGLAESAFELEISAINEDAIGCKQLQQKITADYYRLLDILAQPLI